MKILLSIIVTLASAVIAFAQPTPQLQVRDSFSLPPVVEYPGTVNAVAFNGGGGALTNLPNDTYTNSWTTNTAIPLGQTNLVLVSGANTSCGIIGVANKPTSVDRSALLHVIATGNIVFTNPVAIHASDFLQSRTITNGNTADMAIIVTPGQTTNMAISQYR